MAPGPLLSLTDRTPNVTGSFVSLLTKHALHMKSDPVMSWSPQQWGIKWAKEFLCHLVTPVVFSIVFLTQPVHSYIIDLLWPCGHLRVTHNCHYTPIFFKSQGCDQLVFPEVFNSDHVLMCPAYVIKVYPWTSDPWTDCSTEEHYWCHQGRVMHTFFLELFWFPQPEKGWSCLPGLLYKPCVVLCEKCSANCCVLREC